MTSGLKGKREKAHSSQNGNTTNGTISVTRSEGYKILDRQAQKYLGMSGDEFAIKYRTGQIPDPDRSEVVRVAMLLPYAKR
jgi:hypothetical protein